MDHTARQLVAGDETLFRALRLGGLETDPEAFGGSYADEEAWPVERYQRTLENNHVVGVFVGAELAGTAGFYRLTGQMSHRGHIWGVVVAQAHRGKGVGALVMQTVLDHARQHVKQVHLGVGTYNTPAIALYQKAGFELYGTEPRSLYVNGRYIDEHMMVRFFDEAPGKN